jgi:hypothetical protein
MNRPSRIIRLKENAPEFDYSLFYGKTGAGDPLLYGGGLAFLMTRLRTPFHEETALLTVLRFGGKREKTTRLATLREQD